MDSFPKTAAVERRMQIDVVLLAPLLERIRAAYQAEQIWLFGSRARGDARPDSDWDVFVVVADVTSDEDLDPLRAWRLQREAGIPADVIPCRARTFREYAGTVNTLSYEVLHDGVRLDAS